MKTFKEKSMKIGINALFLQQPHTGIGQVTLHFLKELAKQKSQNHQYILYLEEEPPQNFRLPKIFKTRAFLPLWRRKDLIRRIWWEKYLLPLKAKRDKCDILVSLYQSATVVPKKMYHLMFVHDIVPKLFPEYRSNSRRNYYWQQIEKAIGQADKIFAVSSRTEKDLIEHLETMAEKISVNYVDIDPLFKKDITPRKSKLVMKKYGLTPGYIYTGGGLEWRKNTNNVLLAYKKLLERNKNEHFIRPLPPLVISGKLIPKLAPLIIDVEKMVKELDLGPYVKILDFVPQEDLPALYGSAQMFVYPSLYEGFGLPVLEAMNLGVPVITAKKSSLPEIGGDSVLYCDPTDPDDIAMVMKNLLLHRELRATLVSRGHVRAQKFSWEQCVYKFLNAIQMVEPSTHNR